MDLLAVLPCDPRALSLSVWRLINERQSGSPLLFTEKLPYAATALAWVPDRRSLSVGDVMGNVFVYDAERQRTIELQKVHDCAVVSVDWVDMGISDSIPSALSQSHKLAPISAVPASLVEGSSESYPDSIQTNLNDSLACGDKFTVLTVLGVNGNIQLYSGGAIPVGEVAISTLFGTECSGEFFQATLAPDTGSLAVLSGDSCNIHLYILNTGLLKHKLSELSVLARQESNIHWLLKQANSALGTISRICVPGLEELDSSLGDIFGEIDSEILDSIMGKSEPPAFVKDVILRQLTEGKLAKLSKIVMQTYDFMISNLLSRVRLIIDHLTLTSAELVEASEWTRRFGILGVTPWVTAPLLAQVKDTQALLSVHIQRCQKASQVCRVLFAWLDTMLPSPEGVSHATASKGIAPSWEFLESVTASLRESPALLAAAKSLAKLDHLQESFQKCQDMYVSILSAQRRHMGARIVPQRQLSFRAESTSTGSIDMRFASDGVELLWVDGVDKALVLCQVRDSTSRQIRFIPPAGSAWKLPKFYRDDRTCAILLHADASASVCLLRVGEFLASSPSTGIVEIEPAAYGFPAYLTAQQLPQTFASVSLVEVSTHRGLCSIYSGEHERVLTLDLEDCDDDEGSDKSEAGSNNSAIGKNSISSSSGEENKVSNNVSMNSRDGEDLTTKKLCFDR